MSNVADPNWPGDQQSWPGTPAFTGSYTASSGPLSGPFTMSGGDPNWPGDQQSWPGTLPYSGSEVVSSSMYR